MGVSGPISHRERGDTPVGNTITIFVLRIELIECYTMNCIGSLTMNILLAYTWCPTRNVPDFGILLLMLKYTDITQNTYIQS